MTKEQQALLKYANSCGVFSSPVDLTWGDVARRLKKPNWKPAGPWQYKWEELVPFGLREAWNDLPIEAKITAAIFAYQTMCDRMD